ncbi:hypothetical protein GCM10010472_11630 [Pseudonocardia halophobica]|uniref:ARB-07466-like C-terminal domain-containing protein n=1 Tax=Pseudonocardia halophobica TaxID=29401 RepID=A0A9W6L7L4_9PSEU|nr:hypothetical protein [Pseudonocardia halophobica]GLL13550.1 hypothetical protein GCM10017577_46940 [Pseudonocardia halophobica]
MHRTRPRSSRRRTGRAVAALVALALAAVAVVALVRFDAVDRFRERVAPQPSPGCVADDPTSEGCLTPAALALHDRAVAEFGDRLRGTTCWSAHEWNPSSDHPQGRACDFFPTRAGTFPEGAELEAGWAVANWLREHAEELDVRYVIWQGRIWYRSAFLADEDGWGRPYNGGGVYDPSDATGGHFDHVHVSVRR